MPIVIEVDWTHLATPVIKGGKKSSFWIQKYLSTFSITIQLEEKVSELITISSRSFMFYWTHQLNEYKTIQSDGGKRKWRVF